MDFKLLKNKVISFKDNVIDKTAVKLTDSGFTLDNKEDLVKLIEKSKTTTFINKETKVKKDFKHRSIAVFADEWSDFFKEALYIFPLLWVKAFSQNISVKLVKSKIKDVKLSDYKVKAKTLPALVIFEDEKVFKVVEWSENILKLVKWFNIDINKAIDEV